MFDLKFDFHSRIHSTQLWNIHKYFIAFLARSTSHCIGRYKFQIFPNFPTTRYKMDNINQWFYQSQIFYTLFWPIAPIWTNSMCCDCNVFFLQRQPFLATHDLFFCRLHLLILNKFFHVFSHFFSFSILHFFPPFQFCFIRPSANCAMANWKFYVA